MPTRKELLEERKRKIQEEREKSLKEQPKDEGNAVDQTIKKMFAPEEKAEAEPDKKENIKKPTEKTEKPQTQKVSKPKQDTQKKNYILYFYDEEDADFLKYSCRTNGCKSMRDFFVKILEEDIKNKKIDINDDLHKEFRSIKKEYTRSSVQVTEDEINKIADQAGVHRLYLKQYIAFIIHKYRLENE